MRHLVVLLLASLLTLASGTFTCATPAEQVFPNLTNDPLYDQDTYQALRDIILDVRWRQTELRQVLRDLSLSVRTARPIAGDIDFRLSSEASPAARRIPITLEMQRATLYEVLAALARQAQFTIRVHPALVQIVPR